MGNDDIYGEHHGINQDLGGREPEDFVVTKLLDIRLKGNYGQLHPDLHDVIQSQVHPDTESKHRSSRLQSHSDNSTDVYGYLSEYQFKLILAKMNNISESWEILGGTCGTTTACKFLVGVDRNSICHVREGVKKNLPKSCKEVQSNGFETNELLVEIVDRDNVKAYAHYKGFAIKRRVPLSVLRDCTGDAGDALIHHLGEKFTTKDFDQDKNPANCAVAYSGAWWYKSCHLSNLNGKFMNIDLPEAYKFHGIHWNTFRSHEYCHAKARMLIRPGLK
ncbi:hypothetical protein JTB14_015616 [Gonioctena quinquepunctata]|nr:hypothetical protein JTB14_015616 [Gonioctena quinquepunctata]